MRTRRRKRWMSVGRGIRVGLYRVIPKQLAELEEGVSHLVVPRPADIPVYVISLIPGARVEDALS